MGGEGMPWNIILIVGLIGFALGLNSGFADYRKRVMEAKFQELERIRKQEAGEEVMED